MIKIDLLINYKLQYLDVNNYLSFQFKIHIFNVLI